MSSTKYEQNNERPILSNKFKKKISFYFHFIFVNKEKEKKKDRFSPGIWNSIPALVISDISSTFLPSISTPSPSAATDRLLSRRRLRRHLLPLVCSHVQLPIIICTKIWETKKNYEHETFFFDCFCSWIEVENSIFWLQSEDLLSVMYMMEVLTPLGIEKSDGIDCGYVVLLY